MFDSIIPRTEWSEQKKQELPGGSKSIAGARWGYIYLTRAETRDSNKVCERIYFFPATYPEHKFMYFPSHVRAEWPLSDYSILFF